MAEHKPVNPEEMVRQLRANIQRRRPRPLLIFVILLIVVGGPLALLIWWVWPRPELPRLAVIAFDQVALAGETVPLRARLAPQDVALTAPNLAGLEVSFEEQKTRGRATDAPARMQARSAANGDVVVRWPAPAGTAVVEFKVAFNEVKQRYHAEDRGRLFTLQAETPVLFVEVAALAQAGPDAWRSGSINRIAAVEEAGQALEGARARHFQVVYLATGAGTPLVSRKMRGWVEARALEKPPFPAGPVLGQLSATAESPPAAAWAELLTPLMRSLKGPVLAVVKDASLAEGLRAAGATAFVVGPGDEPPQGITRLPSWAELEAHLPK